jgi:hypothetical protein
LETVLKGGVGLVADPAAFVVPFVLETDPPALPDPPAFVAVVLGFEAVDPPGLLLFFGGFAVAVFGGGGEEAGLDDLAEGAGLSGFGFEFGGGVLFRADGAGFAGLAAGGLLGLAAGGLLGFAAGGLLGFAAGGLLGFAAGGLLGLAAGGLLGLAAGGVDGRAAGGGV